MPDSQLIACTFGGHAIEGSQQWQPYNYRTAAAIMGERHTLRLAAAGDFDALMQIVEFANARLRKFCFIDLANNVGVQNAWQPIQGFERFEDHELDQYAYPQGVRHNKRTS